MVLRQWSVLRRYPDFAKLFVGNTTSQLGSSITTVALPLTAVVFLEASPAEMGLLGAVAFLPHLVLGLPAGVWIDRLPYRRILVVTDVARAVLLSVVPVLALLGALRMWHLYVVVTLVGMANLFAELVGTSFVPALVGRAHLLQANSLTSQSNAVVNTTGSAFGGVLVQLLSAPVAILADAVGFVVAAICRWSMRTTGPETTTVERRRLGAGVGGGLSAVFRHDVLRAMVLAATIGALAGQMQNVVLVLYLARDLSLPPALVGVAIAVSGAAAVVGAVLAAPVTERIGHGPGWMTGTTLASLAGLVMAAAAGPLPVLLTVLVAAQVLRGAGPPLYSVNQVTIRQALAPPGTLARVNATWRFLVFGMQPIGALLGGLAGEVIGLRATLVVSSVVMLLGTAVAVFSPLRSLRTLPDPSASADVRRHHVRTRAP